MNVFAMVMPAETIDEGLWNRIWSLDILGISFYHLLSWFFLYSFLGWIWETCYCSIPARKYINRGFVFGPCITIYGFGALGVYLALRSFTGQPFLLFLGGMILATMLEYTTSWGMEKLFHARWWDYSNFRFNINGRVCLWISMGWGLMSLSMFYILQPFVSWITRVTPETAGRGIVCTVAAIYLVDNVLSTIAAGKMTKAIAQIEKELQLLDDRIENKTVSRTLQEMKSFAGTIGSKVNTAQEEISGQFDSVNQKVGETVEELASNLTKNRVTEYLEKCRQEWMQNQDGYTRRFMNAYPNLSRRIRATKDQIMNAVKEPE